MDKQTRDRAKAVNFGIVYGISPFGLAQQLGIEQKEARPTSRHILRATRGCAPTSIACLRRHAASSASAHIFGRIRPIPDIQSRNANLRGFAERTALTRPCKGRPPT